MRFSRQTPSGAAVLLGAGLFSGAAALLVGVWLFVGGEARPAPAKEAELEEALLPDEVGTLPFDSIAFPEGTGECVLGLRFTQPWDGSTWRGALAARVYAIRHYVKNELAEGYPEAAGCRVKVRVDSEHIPGRDTRLQMRSLGRLLLADKVALEVRVEQTLLRLPEGAPAPRDADFACADTQGEGWLVVMVEWRPWSPKVVREAEERAHSLRLYLRFGEFKLHYPEAQGEVGIRLCCLHAPDKQALTGLRRIRGRLEQEGLRFSVEVVSPGEERIVGLDSGS